YENVYKQVLTTRQPTFRQQLRNWLAPITSWNTYVAHRWSAGRAQYDLSRELQQRGEDRLASAVMKTSFATCPTQFAKPDRLVNLFRTIITAPFSGSPGSRDNESVLYPACTKCPATTTRRSSETFFCVPRLACGARVHWNSCARLNQRRSFRANWYCRTSSPACQNYYHTRKQTFLI